VEQASYLGAESWRSQLGKLGFMKINSPLPFSVSLFGFSLSQSEGKENTSSEVITSCMKFTSAFQPSKALWDYKKKAMENRRMSTG